MEGKDGDALRAMQGSDAVRTGGSLLVHGNAARADAGRKRLGAAVLPSFGAAFPRCFFKDWSEVRLENRL
jgi:hypothetical protein